MDRVEYLESIAINEIQFFIYFLIHIKKIGQTR